MDSLFFITAKIFWFFARVESWIVLLLLLAALAFQRGQLRRGNTCLLSAISALLILGIFPVGDFFLHPLEARFPARPIVEAPAGIIVLGGAEEAPRTRATGLPAVNDAAERFLAGIALAKTYPEAKIIFSGGSGALLGSGVSGATVAAQIFADSGIAADRVVLERDSRNTAENAGLTRLRVDPTSDGPWLLVTSAFHMPRAVGAFCAAGWTNLVPYPVDFRAAGGMATGWNLARNMRNFNLAMKEWIGLVAYRMTGRTDSLLSEGC